MRSVTMLPQSFVHCNTHSVVNIILKRPSLSMRENLGTLPCMAELVKVSVVGL